MVATTMGTPRSRRTRSAVARARTASSASRTPAKSFTGSSPFGEGYTAPARETRRRRIGAMQGFYSRPVARAKKTRSGGAVGRQYERLPVFAGEERIGRRLIGELLLLRIE